MWNKDKVAECVVTFQEIAEIHRQIGESHFQASKLMLEGAMQFSKHIRPSMDLMSKAMFFQETQKMLLSKLLTLMDRAEKQILGCKDS